MKNLIFRGGELTKNQYREGIAWRVSAWTVYKFKDGLGKKEWVVFFRGGV